jgi:dTDP-4-dehydrorhamnose reductase
MSNWMEKKIIAATGIGGMVGSRMMELLGSDFNIINLSIDKLDITNRNQVDSILKDIKFDYLLHLAAYTNVDKAETERNLVKKINVDGTKNLFDSASAMNKGMIYISTDFVFDGKNPPFTESSTPNPIGYYGKTKYEGENIVKNKAMIIRFCYPYRAKFDLKKDVVRNIIESLQNGQPIKGVVDQIFTFTFIDDIAYGLKNLLNNYKPEIFHLVGADSLSGYDAIITIADVFDLDVSKVGKITYDEFYKDRALRPKKSIMKSEKNNFYKMKTFREGLIEMKKQL